MNQQIYCGNNLYEIGNRRIGTPYECLRKGVGQGLHSDLTGFNPNYQAIIADNIYCGTGIVPPGKQLGTPTSCLRKGIGIGKKLQYDRGGQIPGRGQPPGPAPNQPLIPRRPQLIQPQRNWRSFLIQWWPVILAILVGVIAAIFKASYIMILLVIIISLIISWFIQSVINK
jgi:hypothetical protein